MLNGLSAEQAKWFLNAFWEDFKDNDQERESVFQRCLTCQELDIKSAEGNEVRAHSGNNGSRLKPSFVSFVVLLWRSWTISKPISSWKLLEKHTP